MTNKERLEKKPEIDEVFIEGYGAWKTVVVITSNGFRWEEDCCHTRGFDTYKEVWDNLDLIQPCSNHEGCCTPNANPNDFESYG